MKYRDGNLWRDVELSVGKSAYDYAKLGGYKGTEEQFYTALAELTTKEDLKDYYTKTETDTGLKGVLPATNLDTADDAVLAIRGNNLVWDTTILPLPSIADNNKVLSVYNNKLSWVKHTSSNESGTSADPFTSAYWKDSKTGKTYKVNLEEGTFKFTELDDGGGGDNPHIDIPDMLTDRLLLLNDEMEWSRVEDSEVFEYDLYRCQPNIADHVIIPRVDEDGTKYIRLKDTLKDATDKTKGHYNPSIQTKRGIDKGLIEVKARVHNCAKTDCAIWTYSNNWPCGAELDYIETEGYSTVSGKQLVGAPATLHYLDNNSAHKSEAMGKCYFSEDEWHIFGLEIKDNYTALYIDRVKIWEKNGFSASFFGDYNHVGTDVEKLVLGITPLGGASSWDDDTAYNNNPYMDVAWVRFYAPAMTDKSKEVTSFTVKDKATTKATFDPRRKDNNTYYSHSKIVLYPYFGDIDDDVHIRDMSVKSSDNSIIYAGPVVFSGTNARSEELGGHCYVGKAGTCTLTFTHNLTGKKYNKQYTVEKYLDGKVDQSNTYIENCTFAQNTLVAKDTTAEGGNVGNTEIYGMVKVLPNTTYTCHKSTTMSAQLKLYKADKSFASGYTYDSISLTDLKEFTTGSDCAYANITFASSGSNFQRLDTPEVIDAVKGKISFTKGSSSAVLCTGINTDKDTFDLTSDNPTTTINVTLEPADCSQSISVTTKGNTKAVVNNNVITLTSLAIGDEQVTITCGDITKVINGSVSSMPTTPTPPDDLTDNITWVPGNELPSGWTLGSQCEIVEVDGVKYLLSKSGGIYTDAQRESCLNMNTSLKDGQSIVVTTRPKDFSNIKTRNGMMISAFKEGYSVAYGYDSGSSVHDYSNSNSNVLELRREGGEMIQYVNGERKSVQAATANIPQLTGCGCCNTWLISKVELRNN